MGKSKKQQTERSKPAKKAVEDDGNDDDHDDEEEEPQQHNGEDPEEKEEKEEEIDGGKEEEDEGDGEGEEDITKAMSGKERRKARKERLQGRRAETRRAEMRGDDDGGASSSSAQQRRLNELLEDVSLDGSSGGGGGGSGGESNALPQGNDVLVHNFTLFMGGKTLLKSANLTLSFGRRYGLVGPNGCGKTTLMRAIASREGEFRIAKHLDTLLVEQEIAATEKSALDTVVDSDETRRILLDEEKRLIAEDDKADEKHKGQNGLRIARIHELLQEIGANSAVAKASSILSGLQFSEEMKRQPTSSFSGGWRMRISLARALFLKPRILLLDEPTNHLDLHALIWLENYLQSWSNTLVIVSHDRDFLTNVCTDILHIWQESLVHYKGNYEVYEKLYAEKLKAHQEAYEKQQKRIKQLKASGKLTNKATQSGGRETAASKNQRKLIADDSKKGKGSGSGGGGGKQHQKTAESEPKQEVLLQPIKDYKVNLFFTSAGELPMPLLRVEDVSFGFPGRETLFENVEFGVNMESRIAIVGPNGTGKTTLLKLMTKELEPTQGNVWLRNMLRLGVYSQHSTDKLDVDKTPVQYLRDKFGDLDYQTCRKYLGTIGLPGHVHEHEIRTLSGGQKSRVVLVELQLSKSHLLLLDEPTNHLDLETIDGLVDALKKFEGGIVVITHNVSLISEVCNEIWVCGEDKTVTKFHGDFDDYVDMLIGQMKEKEKELMYGVK